MTIKPSELGSCEIGKRLALEGLEDDRHDERIALDCREIVGDVTQRTCEVVQEGSTSNG